MLTYNSMSQSSDMSSMGSEYPAPVNPRRLTLAQLVAEVSPIVSPERTPRQQTIDDILIDYVERDRFRQTIPPVQITGEEVSDDEREENDVFDEELFSAEELQSVSDLPTQEDAIEQVLDEDKREGLERSEEKEYETLDIEEDTLQIVKEERSKRTLTPTAKIEARLLAIEEARQMKRIIEERRQHLQESRAERLRREEEKARILSEKCEIFEGNSIAINQNENSLASMKSTATELGETRQECINTQTLLTRKQYTESGSDFAMMRFLHCPETPSNVDAIGDRDDCLCWLCGYPMMTKQPYVSETTMIKPVHGQVSPEHTFPVMAGNSLIGLPTKQFQARYKNDKAYMNYAVNFLKKGLTYSHFWCNEVKNALRLVTWPQGELPKPNERNIEWLLKAMWYGIKRARGNRWFDKNVCFVIYTKGAASYKFYNIVHYFTLRGDDWQGIPSAESINAKGKAWIASRKKAISDYVQDICNDIRRFTQQHHGGLNTPIHVLSDTLKAIYKDRVIKGSNSTIVWPPGMAVKVSKTRRKREEEKREEGKKHIGPRPKSHVPVTKRGKKLYPGKKGRKTRKTRQ